MFTMEQHLLYPIMVHNIKLTNPNCLVIASNFNESFKPYNKIIKKYKVLLFANGLYNTSMYNQPFIILWSLLKTLKMPNGYKHPVVLSKNLKYLSIDYWFERNMKCPKHIVFVSIRYNEIPHHLSKKIRGISAYRTHITLCVLLPKKLVYLNIGHYYKHSLLPKGLIYFSFIRAHTHIPINTSENIIFIKIREDDNIVDGLSNSVKNVQMECSSIHHNMPNSVIKLSPFCNIYNCIDFKEVFECETNSINKLCDTYGKYFQ